MGRNSKIWPVLWAGAAGRFLKHRICSGITSSRSPLTQILWDLWQAAAQSTRQDAHLCYGRFMMWQCCLYYLQNRRAVGSAFHVTETKTSWSSSVFEGKILSWQYNPCWDQVDLLYVTDGKQMFWVASTYGIYGNIPVVAACSNFESRTFGKL